jgi:tetratricopeptide (TPR) repeat protein
MGALAALLALSTAASAEKANELYQAKDYAGAAAAYATLAREQPKNPLFAFRQGASLLALGRGDAAAPLFDQAGALGFPKPLMKTWFARAQVQMGRLDAAFEALEWAARAGFSDLAALDGEAAFAPLRADPRFAALRATVDRNARPCSHDPAFRQLDFWLGDWQVTSAGAPAGTSRVEKILNDCVLLENWTGALGISG